jgi:hypothetical protein
MFSEAHYCFFAYSIAFLELDGLVVSLPKLGHKVCQSYFYRRMLSFADRECQRDPKDQFSGPHQVLSNGRGSQMIRTGSNELVPMKKIRKRDPATNKK